MDPLRSHGWLQPNRSGRWVRHGYPNKAWQRFGIEVRATDVDRMDPPGSHGPAADAIRTQEFLWSEVRVGDPVELELLRAPTDSHRALFGVMHRNRQIGVTTEHFGSEVYRDLKVNSTWNVEWPRAITGLAIDGVDTVAGSVASGRRAGLDSAGVWLRPRVVGMGDYDRRKGTGQ